MSKKGSYCLCIKVNKNIKIEIGSLGSINFSPSKYIYIGSALNGLEPRIKRHINTSNGNTKAIHWHIDYLLSNHYVKLESIYIKESSKKEECEIAAKISQKGIPIMSFGCSDCNCKSHLYEVRDFESLNSYGLKHFIES
jgi:Uri superfamily endonuclease